MTSSARSNQRWIDELRAGNDAALTDLREVLRRGLTRALASNSNVDPADIEDFAQDGVMRALTRLDSYRGDSRFTTWAHAVAINNALTELRRQRWQDKALEEVDATGQGPIDSSGNPVSSAERDEVLGVLQRALDEVLTDRQRQAMSLLLEELPYAVVADRMGMKLNALYKLAHDARRRLRQAFHDAGFEDQDVRNRLAEASES